MNAARAQPESTPRQRWLFWAILIFAAQTGLVFWLGAKKDLAPRAPNLLPPVSLAASYDAELAALCDPTLFVLPSRHGFSGAAWALTPPATYAAADWDEPFRALPLPAEKLGASFRELLVDLRSAPLPVAEKIDPQISALDISTDPSPLPVNSWLRLAGGIAGRALLPPLDLPAWPVADVLPASEVRVLVDASGRVMSAVLLASSGLSDADQKALELARTARFAPLADAGPEQLAHPLAGLSSGKMIFQWHTVAPAPANEPPPANP